MSNKWDKLQERIKACLVILAFVVLLFIVIGYEHIGYRLYSVVTDSMNPVIPPGSLVLSKIVNSKTELNENDIITFHADLLGEDIILTHYLKKIEVNESGKEQYYTQGNNADRYDDFTTYREDIVGTYIFHIPYLGRVIQFLKSPFGMLEILIIILLTINQHVLGRYFDAQDRLILQVPYDKKLKLRDLKIKQTKEAITIKAQIQNPSKEVAIVPSKLCIELLGKKEALIETQWRELPAILPEGFAAWECMTEQVEEVIDYRVTMTPLTEEEESQ